MSSPHLNDEQFSAYLLDPDTRPDTAAHLCECARCREELVLFQNSVASFNTATLAWSEGRSRSRTRMPVPAFRNWLWGAGFALATCLLFLAAFFLHRSTPPDGDYAATSLSQSADSDAEIERDNQLMSEVNLAINPREQSLVAVYGLSEEAKGVVKRRPESRVE